MPPKSGYTPGASNPKKRKGPPLSSAAGGSANPWAKRTKTRDARTILTQTADAALSNGELDLQSFLKAREFEIKALEDGMLRSKDSRATRAFQQVPRDLRRRTASHNVKRVPKRLQKRAAKEMKDDNTPDVKDKKKPVSSRGRLRAETAKKLGILAKKNRAEKAKAGDTSKESIASRVPTPKLRQDMLNNPSKSKPKFRKRQINKTWLPTHLWHAKRATMTEPKNPLWRFAVPLTSTEKSYRPTHRAGGAKGAIAWDTSYMSTIGLNGQSSNLLKILLSMGVPEMDVNGIKGKKWRAGKRTWSGWLGKNVDKQRVLIGPSTVVWDAFEEDFSTPQIGEPDKKPKRQVLIRVHPAAFLETWTELLRLSKLQRPIVHIEDLRFEIGSIEMTGPGSTEALLGILHPFLHPKGTELEPHAQTFKSLAGVTNAASLPPASLLSFSIMDPRLRYPPRKIILPNPGDEQANFALLEMLSNWPADQLTSSSALFDRDLRYKATRLPSQKSLNRRKAVEAPGDYASTTASDPAIPVMLLTSRMAPSSSAQGGWTLLAPWKCILPIWYGLMHYPLSSGGNPRFGGQNELRQIHFEHGVPWFPADFPGTNAGFTWELDERVKRKAAWERRPKGKRTQWESLDLGGGRKGEFGLGWACDFEKLAQSPTVSKSSEEALADETVKEAKKAATVPVVVTQDTESPFRVMPSASFHALLSSPEAELPDRRNVITVRITLLSRGIATPCARIYRLPAEASGTSTDTDPKTRPVTLRQRWLSHLPALNTGKPLPSLSSTTAKTLHRLPLNAPLSQRKRLLAQQLLQNPPQPYPAPPPADAHPLVPDERDIIGFVTTGEFNLAEGRGVAVGTVFVRDVLGGVRRGGKGEGRLCVVRNSGEAVGRLARWEIV